MIIARTAGVCAVLAAGAVLSAPATSGPIAVYWMSASTTSGMAAMAAAMAPGGKRPGLGSMMGMAMRGGPDPNASVRSLVLQLGSREAPQGPPAAEHDPPETLGVGPSLPLLTPQPVAAAAPSPTETAPEPPRQFQQPHGRMLIFWGCGEHAPAGQPLVIDFATIGQSAGMQQMMGLMRGLSIQSMQPPSVARDKTYGDWPNAQSRIAVPATGSLQGAHTIKGDYSPTIQFTLGADQDFLGPLILTTNQKNPSGSATLAWTAVDRSQGYFASMFGAGGDQVVMWTSSASQAPAFGFPEYLANGEIRRLVGAQVLMPPSQTTCIIPQEVVTAAGRSGFFSLAAYGGEYDIAYPPRPPAPRPWNIAWTVKVRYRSSTTGILGTNFGAPGQPQQEQQQKKPSLFHGLGGIIP